MFPTVHEGKNIDRPGFERERKKKKRRKGTDQLSSLCGQRVEEKKDIRRKAIACADGFGTDLEKGERKRKEKKDSSARASTRSCASPFVRKRVQKERGRKKNYQAVLFNVSGSKKKVLDSGRQGKKVQAGSCVIISSLSTKKEIKKRRRHGPIATWLLSFRGTYRGAL